MGCPSFIVHVSRRLSPGAVHIHSTGGTPTTTLEETISPGDLRVDAVSTPRQSVACLGEIMHSPRVALCAACPRCLPGREATKTKGIVYAIENSSGNAAEYGRKMNTVLCNLL